MKRFLVFLVGLAVLALGANVVVERIGEQAIADAVAQQIGAGGEVSVEFDGAFPAIDLLRGRLAGARVTVEGATLEGLQVRRLSGTIRDVTFDGSPIGGGPLSVRVGAISFAATIGPRAINQFLKQRDVDAAVTLRTDEILVTATRTILGREVTFRATGPLTIDARDLVFRPSEVDWDGPRFPGDRSLAREATGFRERLPTLPFDMAIGSLTVRPQQVLVSAEARGQRIQIR